MKLQYKVFDSARRKGKNIPVNMYIMYTVPKIFKDYLLSSNILTARHINYTVYVFMYV
jgi:hypothetical protein